VGDHPVPSGRRRPDHQGIAFIQHPRRIGIDRAVMADHGENALGIALAQDQRVHFASDHLERPLLSVRPDQIRHDLVNANEHEGGALLGAAIGG